MPYSKNDINVKVSVEKGSPQKVIMDHIKEFRPDFVVVGSRGMSAFKSMVLGSVSDYILQHSSSPVVVYRPSQ